MTDIMRPAEFSRLAEYVFGSGWKRPMARELGRCPKMIRMYASGDAPIPAKLAQQLRDLATLSPIGAIIRDVVLKQLNASIPKRGCRRVPSETLAHQIAARAIEELSRVKGPLVPAF